MRLGRMGAGIGVTLALAAAGLVAADPVRAVVDPPWDPFFASSATAVDAGAVAPASNRSYGVAVGAFDADANPDIVAARADGRVVFASGNGDGTFGSPSLYPWKLESLNGWSLSASDLNVDGNLDVVWGATATGADSGGATWVNDGDVRVLLGDGAGGFDTSNTYVRSGITFNAGTLIGDIGTDTGSVTTGDVDGDGDADIVAGTLDGNTTVKWIRNDGGLAFTTVTPFLVSQPATTGRQDDNPVYWPALNLVTSPWGLALGDADGDGDLDLFVGDRALYVYLYRNDGTGGFTEQTDNTAVPSLPNVYLQHDTFRASVGFTPAIGAGDVNGDGLADLALGIHSGSQTPTSPNACSGSPCPHDGELLLDVSTATGHKAFGALADVGTAARGTTIHDVTGDGYVDIVAGVAEGQVQLLRQLTPLDSDGDGISDYVDNAPEIANAARLDMNTDGSVTHRDQLDNDFDTVLGDPEDPSTWSRLGDPADPDDDNDGVTDETDNCSFTPNAGQVDADADTRGDACDPLDDRDDDGDGILNGPFPGDPRYELARAAAAKWSTGSTHFVIRIDALSRFFQNEFSQILTDAATLDPAEWAAKCWEDYGPGGGDPADPCGTDEGLPTQTLTLPGGADVPVSLVVIPKQLWSDPPVVDWINDRNDSPTLEIGQHGTYHATNTAVSDWAPDPERNFFSCETCGLSVAENIELLRVGHDSLLGNYTNAWVAQSGATAASPKIDWSTSAWPLSSYAPPFNASDTAARDAMSQLGLTAFSASRFEEDPAHLGWLFSPEGSHHEQFDQFGMFHASADWQVDPPEVNPDDTYDVAGYAAYLDSITEPGGLNTWLIEEVEWSGRADNYSERDGANRETNTVFRPRWDAWLQLLDHVEQPGNVVMTMGEVALAKGFDNAPTVPNADQADSDHDGVGDVVDGAVVAATDGAVLHRNQPGQLQATLANAGLPLAGQTVQFAFDAAGDGTAETSTGVTDANGVAAVAVTPTAPVGPSSFTAAWTDGRVVAEDTGDITVADATSLTLDPANPASGQVGDPVAVGATLTDSDGAPLAGYDVDFTIGASTGAGTTDASGHASATLTLVGPPGPGTFDVSFAGTGQLGSSSASTTFTVAPEDTALVLADAVWTRTNRPAAVATLSEADGAPLAGRTITFYVAQRPGGPMVLVGTASTDAAGVARMPIPTKWVSRTPRDIRADYPGETDYLGSTASARAYRL